MDPEFFDQLSESMFTYHPPTPDQVKTMEVLTEEHLKPLARVLIANTPRGAALTTALRKLHEFRMAANYAIVGGK